jgi:hypothetical protein
MRRIKRSGARPAAVWLTAATASAGVGLCVGLAGAVTQGQGAGGRAGTQVTGQGHGGDGTPNIFQPPEDVEQEDLTLPPGSIGVELRDADDHGVAGEVVTLGALINSIAKGDTRKHFQMTTDAHGRAVFSGLEMASNIAYRVSSGYQGGSFAATPFQLPQGKALRVVLHVYPVTRSLSEALVVSQAVLAIELRDDRLQIEEALTLYNLGRTAWQPEDVNIGLPAGFTGFSFQASMTDQAVEEIDGSARLRGTFPPGQHAIEFRWQFPWGGEKDLEFEAGLPPHTAIARVLMPSSGAVTLAVADFPPAQVLRNSTGQPFLVTEIRMRPDEKLQSARITLHDLPTPGPGRLIATTVASFAVGMGLFLAFLRQKRSSGDTGPEHARSSLLEELARLEDAHEVGDVGVRTYERARRELIDALAFSLAAHGRS